MPAPSKARIREARPGVELTASSFVLDTGDGMQSAMTSKGGHAPGCDDTAAGLDDTAVLPIWTEPKTAFVSSSNTDLIPTDYSALAVADIYERSDLLAWLVEVRCSLAVPIR